MSSWTISCRNYVAGSDREQIVLFPSSLDDYINKENPVRFIDAFVDSLDLREIGFEHTNLSETGRPPYDPADLLKLYIHGYLNQVRSSRKLERACKTNVELMWLLKKLTPDFKTIADFRKDNIDCIKPVFKQFVYLCQCLDLFGGELVAIDGSKFKAVNSRNRNFNQETLKQKLEKIEESIENYLEEIDSAESDERETVAAESCAVATEQQKSSGGSDNIEKKNALVREKIKKLNEKKEEYAKILDGLKRSGQKEISLTDPDSRLMRVDSQKLDVCYNVQSAVDAKNHLIVEYGVTNSASDYNQLSPMAESAKEILGVDNLNVTADTGYHDAEEIKKCVENGITPYIPESPPPNPKKSTGVPAREFYEDRFIYNRESDTFTCPAGDEMEFWRWGANNSGRRMRLYRTTYCYNGCPLRALCTTNKRGRLIYRWEHAGVIDALRAKLKTEEGLNMIKSRKEIVEHPFGTMKRAFNQGYLLLKGLRKVKGEVGFTMLAYNLRRVINMVGTKSLISSLRIWK